MPGSDVYAGGKGAGTGKLIIHTCSYTCNDVSLFPYNSAPSMLLGTLLAIRCLPCYLASLAVRRRSDHSAPSSLFSTLLASRRPLATKCPPPPPQVTTRLPDRSALLTTRCHPGYSAPYLHVRLSPGCSPLFSLHHVREPFGTLLTIWRHTGHLVFSSPDGAFLTTRRILLVRCSPHHLVPS